MGILFSPKTNKKANNIFQMKTQIRLRAEAIRRQEARGTSDAHFSPKAESSLFRYAAPTHYEIVGKEPGYESN